MEVHIMPVFFGETIRNARKALGLTQRQLSQQLGVSNTSVSNWEKGLSRPDADMIQKLCHILQLDPNYFYGTENAPASERKRTVSDEEIKFALFGGDGEITDAMYDEVKRFAAFLKAREAGKKE
jgi:transcriptional regulator with XRE-family HTH domain